MKRVLFSSLLLVLGLAHSAFAQDARTIAKEFSHTLSIEGAGKLTLTYKSLHWNEPVYLNAKKNDQVRARLVGGVWKKIGKLDTEFDLVIGGTAVAKGSYDVGISFGANDDFAIVLRGAGNEMSIPLKTAADSPDVNYLSFDLRPASDTDSFVFEGRSGKFRSWVDVKVPFLTAKTVTKAPEKKP